jgi:biopolymer transport protein ExbD
MKRKKKERKQYDGKDMRLQLTSMIDVVFLLLLFFLCSPFRSPEGELDAHMPDGSVDPEPTIVESTPLLHLTLKHVRGGAPRLLMGLREVPTAPAGRAGSAEPDFDWLAAKLLAMGRGAEREVKVQIESDPLVRYGYVVNTLNACTKAGVTDVRFAYPRRVSSS